MSASRKVQVGDRAEEGPVHVRLRRFNSRLYAVLFTYYFRLLDDAIELKKMLPEGVLSIAIRADFWQLQKNVSGIDQMLTSACCPRQNEHIDIKRVACNHVTAILQ